MPLAEINNGLNKWLGKMPSGITLVGLIGLAVLGIWNGAKLEDQIIASDQMGRALQVRLDSTEKLIDADSRRIDAISFRVSAADDRMTAFTTSITNLTTELSSFKEQMGVFDRQLAINMAELRTMLQSRLPAKPEDHVERP